ncbi:uncharacterized protein PADG_05267 [Paracoccidioides brasiliensis Pb18]|uniref:Cell pattern formation-associated protein stuA n=1 Tax=Paracoccidioides brasiliensis (strain Pb18) TaxID=502780 RepID=C1GDD1_PARBD|nr:uncharacterized protein PADG_05267 [Paracoccidioides brasiliensis Pb18]EEH49188.2 hypothetical protein PADG_05267 [Paracoccidioides brasiliensis Pb18]
MQSSEYPPTCSDTVFETNLDLHLRVSILNLQFRFRFRHIFASDIQPMPISSVLSTVCANLELPSISQVQTRFPIDVPWYNHHAAERPLLGSDKLPALTFPHTQPLSASGRTGSQDSLISTTSSSGSNSAGAVVSYFPQGPTGEAKNPPPSSSDGAGGVPSRYSLESTSQPDYLAGGTVSDGYSHSQTSLGSMNQTQPYLDVHTSHLSSAQPYSSHGTPATGIPPYQYSQPPVLQSGSSYSSTGSSSYPSYGYSNGVTSPQSATQAVTNALTAHVPAQILPLPAMTANTPSSHAYMPGPSSHGQSYLTHTFDTTGQIPPPGAKPRVTATLWEDEGSLCFQVEAKGVCVARREDNQMINGTKLLNVAGMTRGRRDGILKSEKVRNVVKIGPMHLKGVWIPFERALEFANKEKITEDLYPLFVHEISALLYPQPTNPPSRGGALTTRNDQRRFEASQASRSSHGGQPSPLHHHHSMHAPLTSHLSQPPHSIGSHSGSARPGLDRSHTFPTPPTSASSLIGIGNHGGSYEWPAQSMGSSVQSSQALSIDTGLTNARSIPTTPATTPPGANLQSMQSYHQGQPSYDSSKSYYSTTPTSQAQYASHHALTQQSNMSRYGQSISANPYIKHSMGPPSGRTEVTSEPIPNETRADQYSHSQGNGQVSHGPGEGEADHDNESDYINDNNTAYSANRGSYTYTTNPSATSLSGEHPHLSPELTDSTSHQNGSDSRITSRTSSQSHWQQGYHTPPRPAPPSSNLYNVMSDTRGAATNGTTGDSYSTSSNGPSAYPSLNGSGKRMRDDDEQDQTPLSETQNGDSTYDHKRRKPLVDNVGGPVGGTALGMPNVKAAVVPRRR